MKVQKQFNGERIVFSTDGAGTTGHPTNYKKKKKKEEEAEPHKE